MCARILVVEDDVLIRQLLKDVLETERHEVLEAGSVDEAVEQLRRALPDLVLQDQQIPGGGGEAVLREVRANPAWTHLRVIAVTASAMQGERERLLSLGFDGFVGKPIEVETFAAVINGFLGQAQRGPAAGKQGVLQTRIARLRVAFMDELPTRFATLRAGIDRLRCQPTSQPALEEVTAHAHALRGTAASYSLPRVAAAACELEMVLRRFAALPSTHELPADVGGAMNEIEAAVNDTMVVAAVAGPLASTRDEPSRVNPAAVAPTSPRNGDTGGQSHLLTVLGRVLLVDDDDAFVAVAQESARRALVDLVIAATPSEAIERCLARPPDAALLKVFLPTPEDGFALAGELRSLPGNQDLPLAFLSNGDSLDHRVAAAQAGGCLFLLKPIDPITLPSLIQHLLAMRDTQPATVLVVDDDPAFVALVAAILGEERLRVYTSSQPARILETLDASRPDLLLLDVTMPDVNGLDICRILRTHPRWRSLPVLFLTALAEQDIRLAAFQAGGDDYLLKPIVREELLARVNLRLEKSRLLRERTTRDPLMGLLQRHAFLERLTAALADVQRRGWQLPLALLDLDRFKRVNDEHGHLVGDHVLAVLGDLFTRRFRANDLRCRWGGEEVVLAFPGEDMLTSEQVLARALKDFVSLRFIGDRGESFHVTFSAGLASYPADGETIAQVLTAADRRLYRAKELGRGRIVVGE